jgi:hypothetical protein
MDQDGTKKETRDSETAGMVAVLYLEGKRCDSKGYTQG